MLWLVIFCFCATFLTLSSRSRYSIAFSNSIVSDAVLIFSSRYFMTGSYCPFKNPTACFTDF